MDVRRKLLGQRLKAARAEARLSQEFAAESLGVTRQSVSAWETGVSVPSAVQLGELATIYCACAHALLFGEPFTHVSVAAMVRRGAAALSQR